MRIKLSPAQAISLVGEHAAIENGTHLFSIHEGLDHVPIVYQDGTLMVNGEFPLSDLVEDTESDVYVFVNSLKSDVENIYSLRFFKKRYSDLTSTEVTELDRWSQDSFGDSIRSEFVNGLLSIIGYSEEIPVVIPIEDKQVVSILEGYYRGYSLQKVSQVNGDYIIALAKKNGDTTVIHNRLSEFPVMVNKAKNSIEKEMQGLQVQLDMLKEMDMELEKTAQVDKSLDM